MRNLSWVIIVSGEQFLWDVSQSSVWERPPGRDSEVAARRPLPLQTPEVPTE